MPDALEAFVNIANSAFFTSRNVIVNDDKTVRSGSLFFAGKAKDNVNTMNAFRQALSERAGFFGEAAFDTTLTSRLSLNKPLRMCDIKKTLSQIDELKKTRFLNEIDRQLATDPRILEMPEDVRSEIRQSISQDPFRGGDPRSITTLDALNQSVSSRIETALNEATAGRAVETAALQESQRAEQQVRADEATGLKNLSVLMEGNSTSVEDNIKAGKIGVGMRINSSDTHPMVLEKLKTNGVEPGFIYHNDWSLNDTRSLMMDFTSPQSIARLNELKSQNALLRSRCEQGNLSIRDQIMLCGYAHPAVMSAVADFVIEKGLQDEASAISKAFKSEFVFQDAAHFRDADPKDLKKLLFVQIREAVMNIRPGNADFDRSPVFRNFTDRHIVKLDYNEKDRLIKHGVAHAGSFRRPERIATRPFGRIYRIQSAQSADVISAGAVTEALANDLSRIMGVPTQDLRIVRGQYSDGHPKIMLEAKFAEGYQDMERGFIKDGQAVKPAGYGDELEKLGKYKGFFMLMADRDAVGLHGQNKGFVHGKFFAIDPGHSLEGNGRFLEVSDNFSFKDNYGFSIKPRFKNFSVFDDDTRFAKFSGVAAIRDKFRSGEIGRLFDQYRAAFDPDEEGISEAEQTLRRRIIGDIGAKQRELNESVAKLLNVADSQLRLYDELSADGPETQEKAIETIENLEKLTSPTTWVSPNGTVALEHLSVIPESRVPWNAHVDGDAIVYHCDQPLSEAAKANLQRLAANSGGTVAIADDGTCSITVNRENRDRFFAAFSEKNVQTLTHTEEAAARRTGSSGLHEARGYVSALA